MHFLKGYATPFLRFGISSSSPLEVVATVTDSDGQPVVRQEVSFTTTDGEIENLEVKRLDD